MRSCLRRRRRASFWVRPSAVSSRALGQRPTDPRPRPANAAARSKRGCPSFPTQWAPARLAHAAWEACRATPKAQALARQRQKNARAADVAARLRRHRLRHACCRPGGGCAGHHPSG
jgi:hypothetical protein